MPPNGLELSCRAARAKVPSFSRILAGKAPANFPHASRVSCSELLGGPAILNGFDRLSASRGCRCSLGLVGCLSIREEGHIGDEGDDIVENP
jgi:hypothetical protein